MCRSQKKERISQRKGNKLKRGNKAENLSLLEPQNALKQTIKIVVKQRYCLYKNAGKNFIHKNV